jgi:hypothetical protein
MSGFAVIYKWNYMESKVGKENFYENSVIYLTNIAENYCFFIQTGL